MVAPKNVSKSKEKPDDKKSKSPSPEPFQEPDGMTTIDLNKSDDYSSDTEKEKTELKKRAQIKYLAQLFFALGSIFIMVMLFIMMAFLNKEYHLFTVIPLKINQHESFSTPAPTYSLSEEFENLSKLLKREKFKEKLKSGNYVELFPVEMDLCKLVRSEEYCCKIFKRSDIHDLSEYCTVNDMLNYLVEYEADPREKVEVEYEKSSEFDTNNMDNMFQMPSEGHDIGVKETRAKRQAEFDPYGYYPPQPSDYLQPIQNSPQQFEEHQEQIFPEETYYQQDPQAYNEFNHYPEQYFRDSSIPQQDTLKLSTGEWTHQDALSENKERHNFPINMAPEIERSRHEISGQLLEAHPNPQQSNFEEYHYPDAFLQVPHVPFKEQSKSTTDNPPPEIRPIKIQKIYDFPDDIEIERSHHELENDKSQPVHLQQLLFPDPSLQAPYIPPKKHFEPTTENVPTINEPTEIKKVYDFPENMISEIERSHHELLNDKSQQVHVQQFLPVEPSLQTSPLPLKEQSNSTTDIPPRENGPIKIKKIYDFPDNMNSEIERSHNELPNEKSQQFLSYEPSFQAPHVPLKEQSKSTTEILPIVNGSIKIEKTFDLPKKIISEKERSDHELSDDKSQQIHVQPFLSPEPSLQSPHLSPKERIKSTSENSPTEEGPMKVKMRYGYSTEDQDFQRQVAKEHFESPVRSQPLEMDQVRENHKLGFTKDELTNQKPQQVNIEEFLTPAPSVHDVHVISNENGIATAAKSATEKGPVQIKTPFETPKDVIPEIGLDSMPPPLLKSSHVPPQDQTNPVTDKDFQRQVATENFESPVRSQPLEIDLVRENHKLGSTKDEFTNQKPQQVNIEEFLIPAPSVHDVHVISNENGITTTTKSATEKGPVKIKTPFETPKDVIPEIGLDSMPPPFLKSSHVPPQDQTNPVTDKDFQRQVATKNFEPPVRSQPLEMDLVRENHKLEFTKDELTNKQKINIEEFLTPAPSVHDIHVISNENGIATAAKSATEKGPVQIKTPFETPKDVIPEIGFHSMPPHFLKSLHVPPQDQSNPVTDKPPNNDGPIKVKKKFDFPEDMITEIERSNQDYQKLQAVPDMHQASAKNVLSSAHFQHIAQQENTKARKDKFNFAEDIISEIQQSNHDIPTQSNSLSPLASKLETDFFQHKKHENEMLNQNSKPNLNVFPTIVPIVLNKLNVEYDPMKSKKRTFEDILPELQTFWLPLPQKVRDSIIHHVTVAPKPPHNYKLDYQLSNGYNEGNKYYEDFDRASKFDEKPIRIDLEHPKKFHQTNLETATRDISDTIVGGIHAEETDNSSVLINHKTAENSTHITETKKLQHYGEDEGRTETPIIPRPNFKDITVDQKQTLPEIVRATSQQDDFRAKQKQDIFTANEDTQTLQQTYINPCFNPYMSPYVPYMPSAKVGSTQEPGFLKVVSVSQPQIQNQPMYVLNPAMYYGVPPSPTPMHPSMAQSPFLPQGYFPPVPHSPYGGSYNSPVQVASPGGQYYMCNPIPTPTNNIAGLSGVEVRRHASNLQGLMESVEHAERNNKSREATLICPLGEQACLDNMKCIKSHHICDNEIHCDDSSDEIACTCKERVGKLRVCDGYCDCPLCEDEQGCFGCEEDELSCDDWSRFRRSTCVPLSQRCDGIKQCEVTGKDEMDCSILTDHIDNFPLNQVSNAVGFLHRNYKGKWYPTCFGTELWAAQVCQVEAGPSTITPKAYMTLTTDPYEGLFVNILPNNEISLVNTCVQDRAAFVECPPIYCGLRFLVNNPYRSHEVDTSIEDMLNDLERAYRQRENDLEIRDAQLDRRRNDSMSSNENDARKKREVASTDLGDEDELTHAMHVHLDKVIDTLERTFKKRDVAHDQFLKQSRVVGGRASQPAAWPWLVSIYKNGIFHCGGVLINELWVVTASHCVDRYWQYYYEIQAGALRRFSYSPMDQRRWAKVIIPHEYYSKSNLRNDIALMKLSAPIRYNKYVRPICLPSETTAGQEFLKGPTPGTICTTVGWGATVEHGADPDHMREVDVPILDHCKHKEDYDVDEICAGLSEGGKDACQGDSGGPLMCRNPNNPNQWYLAGIVSHGEGCARPNEPGVYTKVSRYMGWIAENTRDNKFTITSPLQKCPGFVCKGTKRCIPKKRRCDRLIDCLLGDDELNCEDRFRDIFKHSSFLPIGKPTTAFASHTVQNVPVFDDFTMLGDKLNRSLDELDRHSSSIEKETEITNIKVDEDLDVNNSSGEEERREEKFEDLYFKCTRLLQVISSSKRCNKVIDCEDGTDELNCSCADYIRNVDPSAICDGVSDCPDLSDETDCVTCNKTEYKCRNAQKCIHLSQKCDGTDDCPHNEDEMDCAFLTNGQVVGIDRDDRSMFRSRGIVTINHLGRWKPLCLNASALILNDEPSVATIVCNLLGFDDYVSYHKYLVENKTINETYSMRRNKILDEQKWKKCNDCCDGLYVSCSNISISTTLNYYKPLEEVHELYFHPWMAAIYSNGVYKCMGTLLNQYWIVTSVNCFLGITVLQGKYLTAVLGKGKLNLPIKGPYEQVIRIIESIPVNDTDILLLRLEENVNFNRYVQAANLDARRDNVQNEKCYAIGRDNEDKVKFVPLPPLKNCLVGFRCFEKKIEDNCRDNHPWGGTIICDSRSGWYPAAVYSEETGHCGFHQNKKYTSVKFYKNQISKIMVMPMNPVAPPICDGLQCSLGNCIPKEKICDGVADCHNGEDELSSLCYEKEKECHTSSDCVCPQTHIKCPSTNRCFSKSSFCDRINNCGEFEDEPEICSCKNYLKLTNPEKICDGVLNCMDRSDEDPHFCSCGLEDFACGKTNMCVPEDMVCDGVKDCPNGEDEQTCLSLNPENTNRTNAGEVMTRTAGIWHTGCFDLNYTTSQLEEMCANLGFSGGSANQLTAPHNLTTLATLRPVLDTFDVVWLRRLPGNKLKLRIRTGHDPYVKFVPDKRCHRLFIACI